MKNLMRFFVACMLLSATSFAGNYTWTGTTNTSWNTSTNWSPNGVPGTSDSITINTTTTSLVLTGKKTVKRLTMTNDTLNLGGDTLEITGTAGFNGGLITNGVCYPQASGLLSFAGTTFGAEVKAKGQIKLNGSTFNSTAYFEHIGSAAGTGSGGNTFNGTTTLKNAGTSTFQLAGLSNDTFNGDVYIINASPSGSAYMQLSHGATSYFNGNIEVSSSVSYGVSFSSAGNGSSYLASGKTMSVGSSGFTGTLLIRNFNQYGNTAQSLSLSGILNIVNSDFEGAISATTGNLLLSGNSFNGNCTFTKTTNSNDYSAGGNHFYGTLTLTNSVTNTATVRFAAMDGDVYDGNVTLNTGSGNIQFGYADTSEFKGNLSINNAKVTLNAGTGFVLFTGPVSQTLNGTTGFVIRKAIMNKSSGGLTLNQPLTIDSTLVLISGVITTDTINILTLKATAAVSGGSSASYVDGPMKKIGNTAFEFPIGKDGKLMKLKISAPVYASDSYVAEYFNFNQTIEDNVSSEIYSFNAPNYWRLNRTSGSSNVKVMLSWMSSDYKLQDTALIKIAVLSDTIWKGLFVDKLLFNEIGGTIETKSDLEQFSYLTITSAGAGLNHSGVICSNGEVKIWGLNTSGQHGDCTLFLKAPTNTLNNSTGNLFACNNGQLGNLNGVVHLGVGAKHNAAVLCNGDVYSWGENSYNQLGNSGIQPAFNMPAAVPVKAFNGSSFTNVKAVAAGLYGTIAIKEDGSIWQWGVYNLDLATITNPGSFSSTAVPFQVSYSPGNPVENAIAVSAGAYHYMALLADGRVICWGRNSAFGTLGVGTVVNNPSYQYPQFVKLSNGSDLTGITHIASGAYHNLALDAVGRVYSWGDNSQSQLGRSGSAAFAGNILTLSNIKSIGAGGLHSLAVTSSGGIKSWGYNFLGQCGVNTIISQIQSPTDVIFNGTPPNIIFAAGGDLHSIALTSEGRVYGFGDDSEYQLALNPSTNPTLINCNLVPNYCISPVAIDITGIPQINSPDGVCNSVVPCDQNINYCVYDKFITSNENWTSNSLPDCYSTSNTLLRIENELFISKNASLTIHSGVTLEFGPNGYIVLEAGVGSFPGAQLILKSGSKLTAAGNCMWKGIEVRGVSTSNSLSNLQSKLVVEPGAIIENAHTAVLLGKWNPDYYTTCGDPQWSIGQSPFDLSGSGGVIISDGAKYQNNAIDIRFATYPRFANSSFIENSNIATGKGFLGGVLRDSRYKLTGLPTYFVSPYFAPPNIDQKAHISIYNWNNVGLKLINNDFINYQYGIYAVDARLLKVESCTFENMIQGITSEYTKNSISYNGFFQGNSFLNVNGQLCLKGGRNDLISGNSFNSIFNVSGNQIDNFVGVYLNNSKGYRIVDNQFFELTYGIIGVNSGVNSGSIIGYQTSGNTFNTSKWAIGLVSNNSGLQIKCNTFNCNDPSKYDKNWYVGGNSLLPDQGQYSLTDQKLPAGNKFVQSPNNNEIFSSALNPLFTYFRHGSSSPQQVAPFALGPINIDAGSISMTTFEEACEPASPCDPPCERILMQNILEKVDSVMVLRDELYDQLDNQNKDALIDALTNPYSADSLFDFLLNSSPLSDTVLLLSVNCVDSLPEENLEIVLNVNSPVSDIVWQALLDRTPSLSPQAIERLLSLQGYNPPYETLTRLEKVVKSFWLEYYLVENDFYRRLSEQDSIGIIIDHLKSIGTIQHLKDAFSLHLSSGELDSAAVLLETIEEINETEEDWITLNSLLLDLEVNQKSIFEMDSIQLSLIEALAATEVMSITKVNAEAILSLLNWELGDFILPVGEGNRIYNNNVQSMQVVKEGGMNMFPNPANNFVMLLNEFIPDDVIQIRTSDGQLALGLRVQSKTNLVRLDIGQIASGLYSVNHLRKGVVIKTSKLIVTK